MTTALQDFAIRVSNRVQCAEALAQRALGADWITAYTEAWRVMDEVYDLVLASERPALYMPMRYISNPNSKGAS